MYALYHSSFLSKTTEELLGETITSLPGYRSPNDVPNIGAHEPDCKEKVAGEAATKSFYQFMNRERAGHVFIEGDRIKLLTGNRAGLLGEVLEVQKGGELKVCLNTSSSESSVSRCYDCVSHKICLKYFKIGERVVI